MRILNLSLDNKILEKDSAVQRRLVSLAETAGEVTVFVPGERDEMRELSRHLTVYSFGGPKWFQLLKMWRRGGGMLHPPVHQNEPPPLGKEGLQTYDLITVQDVYFLGLLAVKLAERFSIPLEVQVHGLEEFSGIRKSVALFVLAKAARIRAVSQRLSRLAVEYGLDKGKIYVLPVYTQIETPQKMPKRKTVPYPFTFLTVGRLVPVKNISLQIRAFARLQKEVPHIRLRIVGDGPERSNLQLTTYNLQLGDHVIFEGEQKDVGRFYEEADAFLFTSDYEGWGRVALEAAAYHLPIIMTNVGLANEVLHNDEHCIVIPVGDEEQLYLAMQELLDRPESRARLGEAAYRAFEALPGREEQIRKQVEEWRSLQ